MSEKLAILGGPKTIFDTFPLYNPYGQEEVLAAKAIVESGVLSRFLGVWHEDFYGGAKVKEFEKAWEAYFRVNHAISVNSATSGLIAAIGSLMIEPGDEIIVSPWTMSATATSILVWNAIPVFADIEPETFNLDPVSVEKNISPRTKAIVVPDIFGHAADLDALMAIARKYNLRVIEDAAQAPGALYKDKYVGTVSDIGVFSLNYHKHIHTGEGGICVTDDETLAERMQLIRNHAEAVAAGKGVTNLANLIGFNFRLGEIESAMGIEQLKKIGTLVERKTIAGLRLTAGLSGLSGLATPVVKEDCTHVYYVYAMILDDEILGISRNKIAAALRAEGVPSLMEGYANLHLLPMYQRKIAYGNKGFPWSIGDHHSHVSYEKGICPVAEHLHQNVMMGLLLCMHDFNDQQVDLVIKAFHKVWGQLDRLREL
jgi:dTDP-4-amino-4,6-dideoxygalactose transaminase